MLVLFDIYIRKLIIRLESVDFGRFMKGMINGIIDAHISGVARHTKMCASIFPYIPFMKRPKSTFDS